MVRSYYFFRMRHLEGCPRLIKYGEAKSKKKSDPEDILENMPRLINFNARQYRPAIGYRQHVVRGLEMELPIIRPGSCAAYAG